ncbi:MAG: zinc ABC transporter substrate-binding protein [Aeropyrum sp.]|nr:zinc ABC transporter substrate-binding protein [Aeropyrum sp.]
MEARVKVLTTLTIIMLAAAVLSAYSNYSEARGDDVLILAETPSIAADISLLACGNEEIIIAVPQGADPHSFELPPSMYTHIKNADIIVVGPHSSAGHKLLSAARNLGVDTVSISEEAYKLGLEPGHEPQYNPEVLKALYTAIVERLSSANPECSPQYEEVLDNIEYEIHDLSKYEGVLNGYTVVADLPYISHIARWLGAEEVIIVSGEEGAIVIPMHKVENALNSGSAIVFISVHGDRPASRVSALLEEMAESVGTPVVHVKWPGVPEPTLYKLVEVARAVEEILD